MATKAQVRAHWEGEVCGARYADAKLVSDRRAFFEDADRARYKLDWMVPSFAEFETARGLKVLEIGLGTGVDFMQWVRNGADAHGRDLTNASVDMVKERLAIEGRTADVAVGDAESLTEFEDNTFDLLYSWGVFHHTPNTEAAIAEAHRVLKPGGRLKIMVYHAQSVSMALIWLLYGPLRLNFKGPRATYADHVESPGTKVYTAGEMRKLVGKYFTKNPIETNTILGSGDLLDHPLSAKYKRPIWGVVMRVYPRWFVKHVLGNRFGTYLTVAARK